MAAKIARLCIVGADRAVITVISESLADTIGVSGITSRSRLSQDILPGMHAPQGLNPWRLSVRSVPPERALPRSRYEIPTDEFER